MGRRRSFYARDGRGRFAHTNTVYRKKSSTRRKIAIAGAGAAAVGIAAITVKSAHQAGLRAGYETGKAHGVNQSTQMRSRKGRVLPRSANHDYSKNPYAKGYKPIGKDKRARQVKRATVGTAMRRGRNVARKREARHSAGRRIKS